MSKKNIIQTIKNKEMDRKEFLKYSGFTMLGLVGLRGVAALFELPENNLIKNTTQKNESRGFGSGKYGA